MNTEDIMPKLLTNYNKTTDIRAKVVAGIILPIYK